MRTIGVGDGLQKYIYLTYLVDVLKESHRIALVNCVYNNNN